MKARYTIIYKLRSTYQLPDEAESASFLALKDPAITATLTTNPEPYFLHVDKFRALSFVFYGSHIGDTAQERLAAKQDWLPAKIDKVRADRAYRTGRGVYLIFEGESDIPTPSLYGRLDTGEFAIATIRPISEIRKSFEPFIERVITAIGLCST